MFMRLMLLLVFLGFGSASMHRDSLAADSGANNAPRQRPERWAARVTVDQYNRFMALVESDLKRRHVTAHVLSDSVTIEEFPDQTLGLDNLLQNCAAADESKWPAIIDDHFSKIVTTLREADDFRKKMRVFEAAAPNLRVRIYSLANVPEASRKQVISRTDLDGTLTVLVLDMPSAMKSVNRADAKPWGKTDEELFTVALKNVRELSKVEITDVPLPDGGRIRLLAGKDFYSSTHALILDQHPGMIGKYGSLVAVPNRQAILCHPINDRTVLLSAPVLAHFAKQWEAEGAGPVSAEMFWLHDGHFTRIPSETQNGHFALRPAQGIRRHACKTAGADFQACHKVMV